MRTVGMQSPIPIVEPPIEDPQSRPLVGGSMHRTSVAGNRTLVEENPRAVRPRRGDCRAARTRESSRRMHRSTL